MNTRIECEIKPNSHNILYIRSKYTKMGTVFHCQMNYIVLYTYDLAVKPPYRQHKYCQYIKKFKKSIIYI